MFSSLDPALSEDQRYALCRALEFDATCNHMLFVDLVHQYTQATAAARKLLRGISHDQGRKAMLSTILLKVRDIFYALDEPPHAVRARETAATTPPIFDQGVTREDISLLYGTWLAASLIFV